MMRVGMMQVFRYSAASLLQPRWILAALALYGLLGAAGSLRVNDYAAAYGLAANVYDVLFITFAGPSLHSENMLDGLTWLLPQLLLIFWLGDAASHELQTRGVQLLPKIGSRTLWWSGKVAALAAVASVYFLLGVVTVGVVGLFLTAPGSGWSELLLSGQLWPLPQGWMPYGFLGWAWLLYTTTAAALVVWQNLLAVYWRNAFYAFGVSAAVWILSWLGAGAGPTLLRWLPGDQSMLLRHSAFDPEIPGFGLIWSLVYNAVLFAVAWQLGRVLLQRMDITGKIEEGAA